METSSSESGHVTAILGDLDTTAASGGFSGVVAIDVDNRRVFERAFGLAHRAHRVPNTLATSFGIASGGKGFTALAIMSLAEAGVLALDQPVRDHLGDDLPLIHEATTIEHLLSHTSGIGDYLDESEDADWADYVLSVPTHTLMTAESYLSVLDGHPQKFDPGARFSYCNSGYVVLAIILERVTGHRFTDVVQRLVFDPAQMCDSGYFRLDELPQSAATGYLYVTGDRANTLHLPVRGSGDGGAFTTVDDLHRFWLALFSGRIVSMSSVEEMVRPRSDVPEEGMRYGLGFWLHATNSAVILEGSDPGVSFRTTHIPEQKMTATVIGNSTEGAWPVIELLAELLPSLTADHE